MGEHDPIKIADEKRIGDAAEATVAEADHQRMQTAKREVELNRIAGDLPDDPKALWLYAEHSLTQSAISMIDTGRAFIKLKEILPHGEYEDGLRERGISPRSAREISAGARRFADRSEKFLKLGRTKLYACLELSDDELDALEDGQSILDISLDDLDRMTTRELKAAIKKRDADLDVKNQLLEGKNKQIDDVAEENARLTGQIEAPEDSPTVQSIRDEGGKALGRLILLRGMANRLSQEGSHADPHEVAALTNILDSVRSELALAYRLMEAADPAYQACDELAGMEGWNPDVPTTDGNIN